MTAKTLESIETLAGDLADKRERLAEAVRAAQAEIDAVRSRVMPRLRRRIAAVATAETALRKAVIDGAEHFVKPRTRVFHGFRVGWRKGKPVLVMSDPEKVVELIDKHLANQVDTLIAETRKPVKSALAQLDARTLKKIGVRISDGVDEPVVEPTDRDIEGLTKALLASMNENAKA